MFWFHLSSCREMSDPKAGTGHSLCGDLPVHPWKQRLGRRVAFGRLQQVPWIKGKENQKFSSAFFWPFDFLRKDASALPERSAVGYWQSSFVKKPAEIYCIDLRERIWEKMISFITQKLSGLGNQGLVDRPIPFFQACPTPAKRHERLRVTKQ
jgi:hypothetical protein